MKKKIFLDTENKYYCYVFVYNTLKEMRSEIKVFRPDTNYLHRTLGQCCPFELVSKRTNRTNKRIAHVFLSANHCGAGIVSHELLHACMWAYNFKKGKQQYPFVINNMREEEKLLHNHTYAVKQFYNFYFDVTEQTPKGNRIIR